MTKRVKGESAARPTSGPAPAPKASRPAPKKRATSPTTKKTATAKTATTKPKAQASRLPEPARRAAAPLQIDPAAPDVDGHALVRAEQCIALLQRRLIKPMGRGGPRGDLTLTQYHALSFLAARGQASVSELKDILGFAQSTTSVLVDKLSRMGLVEKLRDRRDHRVANVVPLPKGLRLVQRYRKNAERNLLALRSVLGEDAVLDVFNALEQALVATAPLEDPRVTRLAHTDGDPADNTDDNDDNDDIVDESDDNDDDDILQAAE